MASSSRGRWGTNLLPCRRRPPAALAVAVMIIRGRSQDANHTVNKDQTAVCRSPDAWVEANCTAFFHSGCFFTPNVAPIHFHPGSAPAFTCALGAACPIGGKRLWYCGKRHLLLQGEHATNIPSGSLDKSAWARTRSSPSTNNLHGEINQELSTETIIGWCIISPIAIASLFSSALKIGPFAPNRKGSSSHHQFSGAFAVSKNLVTVHHKSRQKLSVR